MARKPVKIALTGGIACGKSLVAKFLNERGVETLDADDVVHEIMPDPAERKRIAAEVFGDPAKRRELEARVHPIVKERIEKFLASPSPANSAPFRIAIIPLLFETHWDEEYDIILCVTSEKETQVARMMATRGYTREEAEARLAAQLPVAEKAEKSHHVIENDGSPDELRAKVDATIGWMERKTSNGGRNDG